MKSFASVVTVARLAQSVEHETLNLRVVGSSPTLSDQIFFLLKTHFPKTEPNSSKCSPKIILIPEDIVLCWKYKQHW